MARGLGALAVIWGHSFTGPAQASVYLFHMPLFFFLSGLLFKERRWSEFFASRMRNLVIPTVAFGLLVALFAVVWSGTRFGIWSPAGALKTAYAKGMFVVFWFPVALCLGEVALNATLRLGRVGDGLVVFALLASYAASYAGVNTPLSLMAAVHALALLRVGMLLRGWSLSAPYAWYAVSVVLIGAAALHAPLSYNMKEEYFGVPFLSLGFALVVTIAVLFLCSAGERQPTVARLLRTLGAHALALMFLQQPIQVALIDLGISDELVRFLLTSILAVALALALGRFSLTRGVMYGRWSAV